MLVPIPVFYALYKTLTVTIEMRHAPFFGWIKDLSARDPSNVFNLFGLLPFDPTHLPFVGPMLWIGLLPLMYGVTMWLLQSLSPPPPDPVQRQVISLMPIIFTIMFSSFGAGLVIYWTWSNFLSIVQQYVIMRRNGVETEIDKWLRERRAQPAPANE
jgi:YidC/Oxa1 family membrane protein insertase